MSGGTGGAGAYRGGGILGPAGQLAGMGTPTGGLESSTQKYRKYVVGLTCVEIYIHTPTPCLPIYIPPSTVPPPRDLSQALGPTPLPPRWARSPSPARTRPPCPRGSPRSLCANWSTVLRPDVRQHRLADWSTTPVVCMTFPSAAPARRRRRPTHQGHPANWPARPPPSAGAPPEGEPLWHHRATRGLPGVGCPPRGEVLDHLTRAGGVHNGPETPPCRRRAPAETLRACQPPAAPTAPLPPVRDRRAPCPVRLAQSCLSTYPPTHFECEMANVM
ncbi:hypothetical protein N7507_011774 [Penicillium longicatenatum]|nr:hypothetical protein N7507_011774 [Penicillium longicatenatum]